VQPESDVSESQLLSTIQEAEQNKVSDPVRQQELAFENVFINAAEGADQNVEPTIPILGPEIASGDIPTHTLPIANAALEPVDPIAQLNPKISATPAKKAPNLRGSYRQSHELGFGDLLNLGLSGNFIKKEFSIEEFEGGISKAELIQSLIDAFYDPLEKAVFENYSNLVFLGTPGSGKSTVCAKLMHYYGTQYSSKPSVVHVTPEKLFEADRLNFHAKMFNFPFARHHVLNNDSICLAERQLIEIAWDFQISFANFYASNSDLYPSVKPFLVLPAEINNETLEQIMRVCPNVKSVILNKCDYGRFSGKNLMMLYQNGCKISVLSGDRTVGTPLNIADQVMMSGFVEYALKI
jgi:flagellar biosynthesis GTPase FlhF